MDDEKHIAAALKRMTIEEVSSLDQQIMDGRGLEYYETAMVTNAAFYLNKIFGNVGNVLESFHVHITFHENEVACSCSCSRRRKICKHIIALLYAWINDRNEFMDVEKMLVRIREMDKAALLQVVENIIQHHPEFTEQFFAKRIADWDEIEPLM